MSKVIQSIEHDAFGSVMNPPEDGGQEDIRVLPDGSRWAVCPWCDKKALKILPETRIHNLPFKCKNNKCNKEFVVEVSYCHFFWSCAILNKK